MTSSADWFARKMAGQRTQPPASVQPMYPYSASQPPSYPPQVETTTKAQSAKRTDYCPECVSENYFRPTPTSQFRCYDCGYPLIQSGSGVSSVKDDAPVQPARQVQTGGYRPDIIVDRV